MLFRGIIEYGLFKLNILTLLLIVVNDPSHVDGCLNFSAEKPLLPDSFRVSPFFVAPVQAPAATVGFNIKIKNAKFRGGGAKILIPFKTG